MPRTGTLLIYGPTGVGKTLDVFSTFGKSALAIVTERGALDSVESNLGFVPDTIDMVELRRPFMHALETIRGPVAQAVSSGRYQAVVMDTGDALCDRMFNECNVVYKGDGRKVYPATTSRFIEVVDNLLLLPVWIVVICHESRPKESERGFRRGGPKLPGSDLIETVPGMFSGVFRATFAPMPGMAGRQRVYYVDEASAEWVTKDRFGACLKGYQTMDLRPICWRTVRPDEPVPDFPPKKLRHEALQQEQGGSHGVGL